MADMASKDVRSPGALTLREMAEWLGARLLGGAAVAGTVISGVNDLRTARPGQISFLSQRRYLKAARETQASAVITSEGFAEGLPCPVLIVEDPNAVFTQVVARFAPAPVEWPDGVHPTAVVADGVELGEQVHVGPGAVIEEGVKVGRGSRICAGVYLGRDVVVGKDCLFYPGVCVRERCVIGNRVILHCGAVVGADGFGYEFREGKFEKIPQTGYVRIDDDVEIGANTTIDRGRFDRTWIQEGVKIDNLVQIAHNVVIGAHSVIVSQSGISGSTTLGRYVTLAGQVGTVGHIHIGDQVTVTARAGVTKDLPARGTYRGTPARPYQEEMRLEAVIQKLPELYRRIQELEKRVASAEKA